MPQDATGRLETLQWLAFQVAGVGPMFGQFGHFHKTAAGKVSDPYALNRYRDETRRLLGVLEQRLDGREWIMGSGYTIADIATFPWVRVLGGFYDAADVLGLSGFPKTMEWVRRCEARPASKKGLEIPPRS
jgi:GST-like protein